MSRSIVYVWDADYPWDVRTEKTCLALTAAGYDVHIVARNKKWSPVIEHLPEGTVNRMKPWRAIGQSADAALGFPAFFSPRWYNLIDRTVRDVNADLIIARDLPLCPTAIRVGRKHKIPVVLDMAENYPALMKAIWETGRHTPLDSIVRNPRAVTAIENWTVKRVDHIIVVVEESAERVEKLGVSSDRMTVVSNTPPGSLVDRMNSDYSDSADRYEIGEDEPLDVIYMGNIEVARGILESIEAVALLRKDGHKVRLRLIGRGRDDALMRQHASSLGLDEDAVQFLGYIDSHKEALGIVASSHVGLIPHQRCESWNTTIPNKLFDYMALGLPVASSDTDPCKRIIEETGVGEVFESHSARSLADLLIRFRDPSLRRKFGDAGPQAILGRYNWEHDSSIFIGALETTIQRSKK